MAWLSSISAKAVFAVASTMLSGAKLAWDMFYWWWSNNKDTQPTDDSDA